MKVFERKKFSEREVAMIRLALSLLYEYREQYGLKESDAKFITSAFTKVKKIYKDGV